MAPSVIPYAQIPSPVPAGLLEACEAALTAGGFTSTVSRAPEGLIVSDAATVLSVVNAYTGSATELAYHKALKQTALDIAFDAHFDLAAFIRGGTATSITGAQVGTFLATIANNYRTLRASIANAANVTAVDAININSGWPSNP